jgi:hypothetical protein
MKIPLFLIIINISINLFHSGYVYDALNIPQNHAESISVLKSTKLTSRISFNNDYKKNMTEYISTGIIIKLPTYNNYSLGWNTSYYIGEF